MRRIFPFLVVHLAALYSVRPRGRMFNESIWLGCVALEILLLARGLRGRLASKYPAFYTYIAFVLLQEPVRAGIKLWRPPLYRDVYWSTEILAVIFGCLVVFEIYRVGLAAYPGTARMARNVLLLTFAVALVKALAIAWNDPRWWMEAAATDIEGVLRAVQAVAIAVLVALCLFYSIPFGKNLRGILLGYGFFVSWSVAFLPFVSSVGINLRHLLGRLYPMSYFVVLGVWLVHLWSYYPNPQPQAEVQLEQTYQRLAAATQRRLQDARGYLVRGVRP
jgi:hypothetical protein